MGIGSVSNALLWEVNALIGLGNTSAINIINNAFD
jgi:hypothetical protein